MFSSASKPLYSFYCLVLASLAVVPIHTYATVYCAHGGAYLKVGMSKALVEKNCGKPISHTKKKTYATRNVAIKQLFYTLKQNTRGVHGPQFNTKTIEMVITVKNNKVMNINLGGTKAQSASVCSSGQIQVGSPVNAVTQACGYPSYINDSYQKVSQGNIIDQETWSLKPSQYEPTLTLIFSNDVLTSIR